MPSVVLIHPPASDPTAPYIALPVLTAYLRSREITVRPIDANAEAFRFLLNTERLGAVRSRAVARYRELSRRRALPHSDALELLALGDALQAAERTVAEIARAVSCFDTREEFFDSESYRFAVETVDSALALISSAHYPLSLGFTRCTTPFGLLTVDGLAGALRETGDPFGGYYTERLLPALVEEPPEVIGISIVYTSQMLPAWSLAAALRRAIPGVFLVAGGPAATQLVARLSPEIRDRVVDPFDAIVRGEGEEALAGLVEAVHRGERPHGVIAGAPRKRIDDLPPPDFDGLDLAVYFGPEPVLPYDATRGCYWGRCAFCHYGLAERGTAKYRERRPEDVVAHLGRLSAQTGARIFYFSEDTIAPRTLERIADGLAALGSDPPIRWATDLRGEANLDRGRCDTLVRGGGLAVSIGLESAASRLLERIDKGLSIETMTEAVRRLAESGIAVEVMCFSDFPTERSDEAFATIEFLRTHRESIALFMFGEFELTQGSAVAGDPSRFDVASVWTVEGDELASRLFYDPADEWESEAESEAADRHLETVSRLWRMRSYPWAGSLSTAHTLLWYDRFGPEVFRDLAATAETVAAATSTPEIDAELLLSRESAVWDRMIHHDRRVTPAAYEAYVSQFPRYRVGGKRR